MKVTKDRKIKEMKEALEKAEVWFQQFGYNRYGIAIADDIKDHTEVREAIKFALITEKMEEENAD